MAQGKESTSFKVVFFRVDQRRLDISTGDATDETQYGYDPDGNVLYAQNMVNGAFSDLYHASGAGNGYDALNQLTAYEQGTLTTSTGSSVPDTVASPSDSQSWSLAALGNVSTVTTNGTAVSQASNAQNETTVVGSATLTYDANGNLTTEGHTGHAGLFEKKQFSIARMAQDDCGFRRPDYGATAPGSCALSLWQ